jgi:hypothetical protein
MNDCPNCKGWENQDLLLVEVNLGEGAWFTNGITVECQHCGMRGPMADQDDKQEGNDMAVKMWNDITVPESFEKEPEIWELARDVRKAQKDFYRMRKKVGKTEHDTLLHKALDLETQLDNAITAHYHPELVHNLQDKLL